MRIVAGVQEGALHCRLHVHQSMHACLCSSRPCAPPELWELGAGENWRYTMNDLKVRPPYCTPGAQGVTDCGFTLGATAYFFTYVILQTYMLTNLFVASIMEHMASGLVRQQELITPHHLTRFQVGCALLRPPPHDLHTAPHIDSPSHR